MKNKYDLIIIGSGPAGQKAAISMGKHGKAVLIVEKRKRFGGGCIQTGTIPSKSLREVAIRRVGTKNGKSFRKKEANDSNSVTIDDIRLKLTTVINKELNIVQNQLARNNIHVVSGVASFIDAHTIRVCGENGDFSKYLTNHVLIATGSSPNRPNDIPFDDNIICDSDSILEMKEIPKSIIVVGAGVIGSEYACIFSKMGVKVYLLNKYRDILNFVDSDLRQRLMDDMKSNGITLYPEASIHKIDITTKKKGRVIFENGSELEASKILYCQGRNGNISELNLKKIGIKEKRYQLLEVNEYLQTKIPHIYACGDVIGYPSLASVSAEQGRLVAFHILNMTFTPFDTHFPFGIYTIPEISFIGKNEEELQADGVPFIVGLSDLKEIARGHIQGEAKGLLKLIICCKTFQLLGVHIIGYGAAELIHIGQAVMSFKGGLHYFLNSVFNYPTFAEAYKVAALNAYNKLTKDCNFYETK